MSGLDSLVQTTSSGVLGDPGFRLTLDAHRRFFLSAGNYDVHQVDDHNAQKYRYDLNGYLNAKGITQEFHYLVMRLNGMTSYNEFSFNSFKILLIPQAEAYREVVRRYRTTLGDAV